MRGVTLSRFDGGWVRPVVVAVGVMSYPEAVGEAPQLERAVAVDVDVGADPGRKPDDVFIVDGLIPPQARSGMVGGED